MLHILLLILKIIGFLLLGLLGLVLVLAFLMLFVPIRYQLKGSFYGRPVGTAKFTWLLHLLTLTAAYDKETQIIVKLFGHRLFTPKEEKKLGRRAKRKAKKTVKKLPKKAEEPVKPLVKEEKAAKKDLKTAEKESADDSAAKTEPKTQIPPKQATLKQEAEPALGEETQVQHENGFYKRCRGLWEKILGKIKGILYALKGFCVKIVKMKHTLIQYKELWDSPECKKAWRIVKKESIRLLRHLKPSKYTVKWHFGFEDPSVTGEVLAWLALFYGWYRNHAVFVPEFEEVVQEGEFYCRGRIRCATLLIIFLKVYFSKDIRFVKDTLFPDEEEEQETSKRGSGKEEYGSAWEM